LVTIPIRRAAPHRARSASNPSTPKRTVTGDAVSGDAVTGAIASPIRS
jgi:hypothetical protein